MWRETVAERLLQGHKRAQDDEHWPCEASEPKNVTASINNIDIRFSAAERGCCRANCSQHTFPQATVNLVANYRHRHRGCMCFPLHPTRGRNAVLTSFAGEMERDEHGRWRMYYRTGDVTMRDGIIDLVAFRLPDF